MLRHFFAWVFVILAVAGASAGLGFYKYSQMMAAMSAGAAMPEPAEAVSSGRARDGEWSATTRAIGTVVALRQLELRNEIAGSIAELGFTSGSIVEAGQMLVQFDTRQERAALAAAEADARLAKSTFDRRESLRNSPAFSAQEYDKAREEYAAATARAKNLEVAIEKKRITAPFKARIGITNLQPGAYLDIGTQIATLQGIDADVYVDFALPQDGAIVMRPGVSVSLASAALPNGAGKAEIVAVDDSVDRANRTVRFRSVGKELGSLLRPGMFLDVIAVTSTPRPTVLVPLAAVRRSPYGQHVFVLVNEDGKLRARMRAVETGPVVGDDIAVAKGLASGELIATSGSFKLRDGLLVNTDLPPAGSKVSIN